MSNSTSLVNHQHLALMATPQIYPKLTTGTTRCNINEKYIGRVVEFIKEVAKQMEIAVINL